MIISTLVSSSGELQEILDLQQQNLKQLLSFKEREEQGFVTLQHNLSTLTAMQEFAPSVIIKDDDKLVGYALTMIKECRELVPDLEPMFSLLDSVKWNGQLLGELRYYVMGQICIAKQYRGLGIFDLLYQQHKESFGREFEFLITEIATSNVRSLRAHQRVGFKILDTHKDELDEWLIVGWKMKI